MITINLLPWREEQRRQEMLTLKKILAVAILASTLLVFCIYGLLMLKINAIENQINELKRIHKNSVAQQALTKISYPQVPSDALPLSTVQTLLRMLSSAFGTEMCLNMLSRHHQQISFSGNVSNASLLTDFLKSAFSAQFAEIHIVKLTYQAAIKKIQFQFDATELPS